MLSKKKKKQGGRRKLKCSTLNFTYEVLKMYTFVSGSKNFNNETGFSSEAVFQNAENSCSLSLSVISCGHTQRLGVCLTWFYNCV